MSDKYTLKQCKEDGMKIWWYLYQHPDNEKSDAISELYIGRLTNHCPCCEFVGLYSHKYIENCINCPIEWGTENKQADYFCEGTIDVKHFFEPIKPQTKYDEWKHSAGRVRKFAALEIYKYFLRIKVDE